MDDLEGTQVIGWDPAAGTIRSWMFDSDGGFGEGTWSKKDNSWIVKFSQFSRRPHGFGHEHLHADRCEHVHLEIDRPGGQRRVPSQYRGSERLFAGRRVQSRPKRTLGG